MRDDQGYQAIADRLSAAGLRPTRQRLMLGRLLFGGEHRHVTAESLHREAQAAHIPVSMATVYNTLHQFTEAKLMRQITVSRNACYFDTNIEQHHHFYCDGTGMLVDIPHAHITVGNLPAPPEGMQVRSVDVVIHVH